MEQWREDMHQDELYHYGILGMKWGVRRYQNPDGTYTEAGKRRYNTGGGEGRSSGKKKLDGRAIGFRAGLVGLAGGAAVAASKRPDLFERNIKRGKDKEKGSAAEVGTKEFATGFGSAAELAKTLEDIKRKEQHEVHVTTYDDDVTKKSDEQLRKEIDRMRLESQWTELNEKQVSAGKVKIEDYLKAASQIAAVGTSAAAIATLILKIKHGGI